MGKCEMDATCPEYATRGLEFRHVESEVTVSRYYCEDHFLETSGELQASDYYVVVGSRELS